MSSLQKFMNEIHGNGNVKGNAVKAGVIFDSRSQKSYITNSMHDKLNLSTISKESLFAKPEHN